jgi:hypothetical protein
MTEQEAIELYKSGLRKTVDKLLEMSERIKELEEIISSYKQKERSRDISTPSGMKAPYEKRELNSKRKRKPGRPKGHEGSRRNIPEVVDRVEEHRLKTCPRCGKELGDPVESRERYIEDIPQVKVEVIRHIIYRSYCSECKKVSEPKVDDALPKSQIGLRTLLMTVWLHYSLGVTTKGVILWIKGFSKLGLTIGGLIQSWLRLAQILKPYYDHIAEKAKGSAVLNVDESGWRVSGMTHWLWCFTSRRIVYYVIDRCRGSPVLMRVLGEFFRGILVSDFYRAYDKILSYAKQKCLQHLFRDLEKVYNFTSQWRSFLKKLRRILKDAIRLKARKEMMSEEVFIRKRERIKVRLEKFANLRYRDKDCKRFIKRIKKYRNDLITFLYHHEVDSNNSHVERQIRPAVIMRKNLYCNRSERGAEAQSIFMSIFRTLILNNIDPVEFLLNSVKIWIRTGKLPPFPI